MAEIANKTGIDIATTSTVVNLGSFKGSAIGAQLTGIGTTSGDSDWKLVQSNDKTNWIDISGATFIGIGNETLSTLVNNGFHMTFLGIQRSSLGTETTGTVSVIVSVK